MEQVMLSCGHMATVTHDRGGRFIQCHNCREVSVVQAKIVRHIEYQISPLPAHLSFDQVKAQDPDDL